MIRSIAVNGCCGFLFTEEVKHLASGSPSEVRTNANQMPLYGINVACFITDVAVRHMAYSVTGY
jgi:hypothetical protein